MNAILMYISYIFTNLHNLRINIKQQLEVKLLRYI